MDERYLKIQDINYYISKDKNKLNKEIGERLKQVRIDKNISLGDLSQMIDTSTSYISQIEKGEYGISLFKFILFCNSLEIDVSKFLQEFIFSEENNEDILYYSLQKGKNISQNILEYMKDKK